MAPAVNGYFVTKANIIERMRRPRKRARERGRERAQERESESEGAERAESERGYSQKGSRNHERDICQRESLLIENIINDTGI